MTNSNQTEMPETIFVHSPEMGEPDVWTDSPDLIRIHSEQKVPGAVYIRADRPAVDVETLVREIADARELNPHDVRPVISELISRNLLAGGGP